MQEPCWERLIPIPGRHQWWGCLKNSKAALPRELKQDAGLGNTKRRKGENQSPILLDGRKDWWSYRRHKQEVEELISLQKETGKLLAALEAVLNLSDCERDFRKALSKAKTMPAQAEAARVTYKSILQEKILEYE